jgi:hypothetical protein
MNKHGRQESTEAIGWQQDEDSDNPDSFVQIPSSGLKNPYPKQQHDQTPTQSNFVNGPSPIRKNANLEDVYRSTSSFHSSPDSPLQRGLPNPFSAPGDSEQPTSLPISLQPLPQRPPPGLS